MRGRMYIVIGFIALTALASVSAQTASPAPAQPIPPAVRPQTTPRATPLPPPPAGGTRAKPLPPATSSQPVPPAPPPPPPAPGAGRATAPRRDGQPININVEATITDQQGNAAPVKKTLSVVVADSQSGSVRTNSAYSSNAGNVPLNMDVEATTIADGKIKVSLRLQYDLPSPASLGRPGGGEERQPMKTSIVESLNVVLENGKSIVAAQSADPVSDRQVVLEVKATVLR